MNDVLVAIENTGNLEIANLGKGLPWLATTAAGAPMLGFLGTVVGMVEAFFALANAGSSANVGVLAGGIYEALVTTVAGLAVGIRGSVCLQYPRGTSQQRNETARRQEHGVYGPA